MAVWGPCRAAGDKYLACVALKGKGQCQSIRHAYEGCMGANVAQCLASLEGLSKAACGHEADPEARMECAAKYVLRQTGE